MNPSQPSPQSTTPAQTSMQAQPEPAIPCSGSPDKSAGRSAGSPPPWLIVMLLVGGFLLVEAALWPWSILSLSVLWAPATHDKLGTVQSVSFVFNSGVTTEITTEKRTFALRGVARFQTGTLVELRSSFFSSYLCEVNTDSCYSLTAVAPAGSCSAASSINRRDPV